MIRILHESFSVIVIQIFYFQKMLSFHLTRIVSHHLDFHLGIWDHPHIQHTLQVERVEDPEHFPDQRKVTVSKYTINIISTNGLRLFIRSL